MKTCDLCGKFLEAGEDFDRNVGSKKVCVCEDCAVRLWRMSSESTEKRTESVLWGRQIIGRGVFRKDIEPDFINMVNAAQGDEITEENIRECYQAGTVNGGNAASMQTNGTFTPNNVVESGMSVWTIILKIVGIVNILGGISIGVSLGEVFQLEGLGVIFGLLIGLITSSIIMVIANMAEDIKMTKNATIKILEETIRKNK